MPGINSILEMASRALMAEQVALEVTNHNLANVNTPGYSRQSAIFETTYPLPSPYGPLGTGVKVSGIERAFSELATVRLNQNTASWAEYHTRQTLLEGVAAFFNETQEGGLDEALSAFFAAWHDVANNPSGSAERLVLLSKAQDLTEAFSFRANALVEARTTVVQQVASLIQEINSHTAKLAQLNIDIQQMEAGGQAANDLRDQRQQELDRLAELIGIRYYTTAEGQVNVTLTNGTSVVQGPLAFNLDHQLTDNDTIAVIWQGPNGVTEDITALLSGGKLTAQVRVRDVALTQYQQDLDNLAQELIAQVNSQHTQGVGLSLFQDLSGTYSVTSAASPLNAAGLPFGDRISAGSLQIQVERDGAPLARGTITVTPSMSLNELVAAINTNPQIGGLVTASVDNNRLRLTANQAGDAFGFSQDTSQVLMALGVNTFFSGDKAYTLGLNPLVSDDPGKIAAGLLDPDTGARSVGDNRNALALTELENAAVVAVGSENLTFLEAYNRLITDMGLEAQQAAGRADFHQSLKEQFQQMRDNVSGVSMDEELANLIKFQRAYQAAARLITVADELYQTLLALKR